MLSYKTRMTQIEQKVEQINEIKQKVSKMETRVLNMATEIDDAKSKITTCNDSIEYFNEMFDDIVTENKSTNFTIDDVAKRLTNLEIEHETIKSSQLTVEGTVLDLQCHSMRENLLFTGIDEAEAENSAEPSENSEDVIRTFFFEEMNIRDEIELDRVHRLGKLKSDQIYPRPIIAKFHRFKDRERVRLAAPKVLRGTAFGVREQFPPEIEAVRHTLYPVAKKRGKMKKIRYALLETGSSLTMWNISKRTRPQLHESKLAINHGSSQEQTKISHNNVRGFLKQETLKTPIMDPPSWISQHQTVSHS